MIASFGQVVTIGLFDVLLVCMIGLFVALPVTVLREKRRGMTERQARALLTILRQLNWRDLYLDHEAIEQLEAEARARLDRKDDDG